MWLESRSIYSFVLLLSVGFTWSCSESDPRTANIETMRDIRNNGGGGGDRGQSAGGGSGGSSGPSAGGSSGFTSNSDYDPNIAGGVFGESFQDFQPRVAAFLDSFLEPDDFGPISHDPNDNSNTGVWFFGRFILPQNGPATELHAQNSNVLIEIYDQVFADAFEESQRSGLQSSVNPIRIRFERAARVEKNQNDYLIVFEDDYQRLEFQGRIFPSGGSVENQTRGTLTFTNKRSLTGQTLNRPLQLGEFRVQMQNFVHFTN